MNFLKGRRLRPVWGRAMRCGAALAVAASATLQPFTLIPRPGVGPAIAEAAAGDIDPNFGTQGIRTVGFAPGSADKAYSMALQADGKIIVAGASNMGGASDFAVARLNRDGSPDASYNSGLGLKSTFFGSGNSPSEARAVALQKDKSVLAGFTTTAGNEQFALARLDHTGVLDGGFGDGDGLATLDLGSGGRDRALAVAIQSDGKIDR